MTQPASRAGHLSRLIDIEEFFADPAFSNPSIHRLLQAVGVDFDRPAGHRLQCSDLRRCPRRVGCVLTGMLSDRLAHSMGPAEGLRWAIIALLLAFFPTGWFMFRAARTIRADFEL
jgi:hypothetical protein